MKCPRCGGPLRKEAPSRYWCVACFQMWLIQKLRTYTPGMAVVLEAED